jgi:hypothetical protein
MPNHIVPFISPIDALYFLYKTLRAEAAWVAPAINHLESDGSCKPLQQNSAPSSHLMGSVHV